MNPGVAINCVDVKKAYKLYQSSVDMAMDRFGLGTLLRWRRGKAPVEFMALQNINLKIAKGERVGIVGRNGAGKTTLLRMISGAATNSVVPTGGKIDVDGVLHALMGLERSNPNMTGRENARSALIYNGLTGRGLDAALKDVIDFVELGEFIDRPVQNYSLGMGMRLNFAVATALSPDILLIDEVLGAGDALFAKKAAERMRRLIYSGCTSVLVSHSIELIESFCDRVIWLKDGRIARDGAASEVLAAYSKYATPHEVVTESLEWRGIGGAPPAYARSSFVRRTIAEAEGFSSDPGCSVTMRSGNVGYRRFAARDAKIVDVRMFAKTDQDNSQRVGGAFRVEIDIDPVGNPLPVLCALEMFTLDGKRVARFVDSEPRLAISGTTNSVIVDQLLVGAREYFVTVALLDPNTPRSLENAFDVFSQGIFISISNVNDSDPPFVHLPAKWKFGDESRIIDGRISGVL